MKCIGWMLCGVIALGVLAGCAGFEEFVAEPAPPAPVVPPVKPVSRELGSLWSEDSTWNHAFAAAANREMGDILTIRLDEAFRARVLAMQPDRAPAKDAKRGPAADSSTTAEAGGILRGKIEQVGPRGVYRFTASDELTLDGWHPFIVVQGRIRDRDIDFNDEFKIAEAVDVTVQVLRHRPVAGQPAVEVNSVAW